MTDELAAYLAALAPREPEVLAALRARTAALPIVNVMLVSPEVARLLQLLVRISGARAVLEIGTFTGYSALAMALALPPEGQIVTLDVSARWTAIAEECWRAAGVADRIALRIGDATATLDALIADGEVGRYDLAFIDANKDGYGDYFERCMVLVRAGGLVVADNTLFGGRVVPSVTDEDIRNERPLVPPSLQDMRIAYTAGARAFNARIARDDRVDAVLVPAFDGLTIARKR